MPINHSGQMVNIPFEQGDASTSSPLTHLPVKSLRDVQLTAYSKYYGALTSTNKKIETVEAEIARLTIAKNNALYEANRSMYTKKAIKQAAKMTGDDSKELKALTNAHSMETRSKRKSASQIQKEINVVKQTLKKLQRDKRYILRNIKKVDKDAFASGHYASVDLSRFNAGSETTAPEAIQKQIVDCFVHGTRLIEQLSNPTIKSSEKRKLQKELNNVTKQRVMLSKMLASIQSATSKIT